MKITLLGQAGMSVLFENGVRLFLDPYLTDALHEERGDLFSRQVPTRSEWLEKAFDILLVSHDHRDHYDEGSVEGNLDRPGRRQILAPASVCRKIEERWPARHNVMYARAGVEFTFQGITIRAVRAFHSVDAVGYVIHADGKTIYSSGDTLYSQSILDDLRDEHIDVAFVCVNGFGCTMNADDAARLANALKPRIAVPVHWDMFSSYGTDPGYFASLVDCCAIMKAYSTLVI